MQTDGSPLNCQSQQPHSDHNLITTPTIHIDAAIVGGGIAGTWALNLLRKRGYNVILLEADALGVGQTLASQGMVHGGLKYALSGSLTGASESIAAMPTRWRACLEGDDEVDLRGTKVLSRNYYMFAADTTMGRLTTFFASRALRGRIDKINKSQWPEEFQNFNGVVYGLNDFVLDTQHLLHTLTHPHADRVLSLAASASNISHNDDGYRIVLNDTTIQATQLISCAGNGSAELLQALSIPELEVQQRPLKQVIVRPQHRVALYAHCLTGVTSNVPRLTITSHRTDGDQEPGSDGEGDLIWYLGGQLADQGVDRTDAEQLKIAQQELSTCVPWLDWHGAKYEILTVNRAEPKQTSGRRPDEAYVKRVGDFTQCFPTKLTLAPDLGDKLVSVLDPPKPQNNANIVTAHPRAKVGSSPW